VSSSFEANLIRRALLLQVFVMLCKPARTLAGKYYVTAHSSIAICSKASEGFFPGGGQ